VVGRLVWKKKKKSLDKMIDLSSRERKEQGERLPTAEKSWLSQTTYALADEYTPSLVPCMRIITLQYSGYRLPALPNGLTSMVCPLAVYGDRGVRKSGADKALQGDMALGCGCSQGYVRLRETTVH